MHFGEPIEEDRLVALLTPDADIHTVITADVYGAGEADRLLGRALAPRPARGGLRDRRRRPRLLHGERAGREGLPALHRPRAARTRRATPPTCGWRPSAASSAAASTASTCCCCTTPTASATAARRSGAGMAALRDAGLTRMIGVAPGPRERLHARRDRLLRALRRADRLGDADPRPARAVAGRARARRRRRRRTSRARARRRLRRRSSTTTSRAGPRVPHAATTARSAPPAGSPRALARIERDAADRRSATG